MSFHKPEWTTRMILVCLLVLLFGGAAQAYTIVLRSGERVQIPDTYRVTQTTLTYEIAPGFYRTILLNTVNVAATERANQEQPGSFLKKAEAPAPEDQAPQTQSGNSQGARRTLTNEEIAAARRRNRARGQAYEAQRRNLPPVNAEEEERRAAEQTRRLQELAAEIEQRQGDTEAAFRAQASNLRDELTGLDAELSYYRTRLAEATQTPSLVSLATPATTIAGVPPFAFPYTFGGIVVGRTPVFGGAGYGAPRINGVRGGRTSVRRGTSFGVNVNVGGGLRGGINFGGAHGRREVRGRHHYYGAPYSYPYGYGFPLVGYTPASDDVIELRSRVRELEAARASLVARRRLLEDEARRAGVVPGALR